MEDVYKRQIKYSIAIIGTILFKAEIIASFLPFPKIIYTTIKDNIIEDVYKRQERG